jgi:dienelactone hydrolase
MRSARFITFGGEEGPYMDSEQPPGTGLGVVLVGLPAGSRATHERFVARGYDVLAVDIDAAADVDGGLTSVAWGMRALQEHSTAAKIAVVGYGFGGRYAFLALTRLGADAAAAFHGSGIGAHLDEAAKAKLPLSLHFGDDDERVPFEEVRAIKGALEGFATTEIYRYPGAGGGFAMHEDAGFNEPAALAAERRVFAFLDALGVS